MTTIAFLRGINLGKRRMTMQELCDSFVRAGFDNPKTVLASGNVVISTPATPKTAEQIEAQLERDFGYLVETVLRDWDALEAMVNSGPFGRNKSEADKKLYVYLSRDPIDPAVVAPLQMPGDYEISAITEREIFATAYRLLNGRFGAGLDQIAKPFNRHFTNRNWNTILRLVDMEKLQK